MSRVTQWALALLCATQVSAVSAAVTGMKFISTAGDYVGQGTTQTYLPPAATITAYAGGGNAAHVSVTDPNNWWSIDFAAPTGSTLSRGSYPDAARYPFNSPLGAGLNMDGDGRGCNTLKGWFRVKEYVLNSSGAIARLAIDFLQNCEVQGPPLYGSVRINSSYPLVVPEMAAIAGADFAVIAGQTAKLNATQSFSRSHSALTYKWTQLDGPAVVLSNAGSATPSFVAPAVGLDGASLHFRLDVTEASGRASRDDVVVLVESASAPRTQVSFHGDAGDYITLGKSYSYDTQNAIINFSRNFGGGVSTSISGATWWNFDTAPPSGTVFGIGTYLNAQRYPFQSVNQPGLSLSGDGRGCNTLTGNFTVHQAQFDSSGNPQTLDISFEQHCEGGAPAAYGEVLLNAVPHATLAPRLRDARLRYGRIEE
jgi:hypothetical protein